MALDFDQSKQNAAKCKPSRHGKTQNVNVPASQNRLVSGRIKNLTTAAKLALLNYSVVGFPAERAGRCVEAFGVVVAVLILISLPLIRGGVLVMRLYKAGLTRREIRR